MKKRSAQPPRASKSARAQEAPSPGALALEQLRALVALMREAELTSLELDDQRAGLRVALRRGGEAALAPMVQVVPGGAPSPAHAAAAPPAGAAAGQAPAAPPGTVEFKSPMVGTFYRAASPDAEPFVEVGSKIDEDTTLCIVEAMKVMNEIKAEMRGTIAAVLVQNGEPIEFGQPLFLVAPA